MQSAYDYSGVNWPAVEKARDVNYSENPHTWSGGPPDIPQKEITSQGVYDYLYPKDEFIPNPDFISKQPLTLNQLLLGGGGSKQQNKPYIYNKEAGYGYRDELQRYFGLRIPPAAYLRRYDPYPVKNKKGILSLAAEKIPTPYDILSLYPHGILEGIGRRAGMYGGP